MIYLASPYTHPNASIRQKRFNHAVEATLICLQHGVHIFSPIVYSHVLAQSGLPGDWDFWESLDQEFLRLCDELWVLTLPGWRHSKGVTAEINYAGKQGKPIALVSLYRLRKTGHVSPRYIKL